jgi:hypothetical protein
MVPLLTAAEDEWSCQDNDIKMMDCTKQDELICTICSIGGKLVDNSSIFIPAQQDGILITLENEANLWKLYQVYPSIVTADELREKISSHFPQVPQDDFESSNALICTPCFHVIQNLLQADENISEISTTESKNEHPIVQKSRERLKRKCAQSGLSKEIIKAELGYSYSTGEIESSADADEEHPFKIVEISTLTQPINKRT